MSIKFLAILLITSLCAQVQAEAIIEPFQEMRDMSAVECILNESSGVPTYEAIGYKGGTTDGSETSGLSDEDLICYNRLKDAFLSERSESFKILFNESFPEPTEEAIEILGCLLPDIEPWQETNPPSTNVIIGTKRINIYGTVGLIIYEARPDADTLEFFQLLLKEIEERELTSGDEVLGLMYSFLYSN